MTKSFNVLLLSLVAISIFTMLAIFPFRSVSAASWSFETTNDSPAPGDWDAVHVGTSAWAGISLDTSIKQEGTGSYKIDNNHVCPGGATDNYVFKKFTTTGTYYTIKTWFRMSGLPNAGGTSDILVIYAPENDPEYANPDDWYYLLNVRMNDQGNLRVGTYWDNSAYSASALSLNDWHELEINLYEDATNGTFSLKVDGTEWISGTGLETNDSYQTSDNRILAIGDVSGGCYSSVNNDRWVDHVRWYRGATDYYSSSPTATPTPTSGATATPTPTSTPQSSSNESSSSQEKTCTDQAPGKSDLFQADTTDQSATLYFSPPSDDYNKYVLSYGLSSGDERYGIEFDQSKTNGVLSYTINHLGSNTTYYARLRAKNGCMPGEVSNELQFTTTSSSRQLSKNYKNILTQIVNYFNPAVKTKTTVQKTAIKKQTNPNCTYKVQSGDSLWYLAESTLGNGAEYKTIIDNNGLTSTVLEVGQTLKGICR